MAFSPSSWGVVGSADQDMSEDSDQSEPEVIRSSEVDQHLLISPETILPDNFDTLNIAEKLTSLYRSTELPPVAGREHSFLAALEILEIARNSDEVDIGQLIRIYNNEKSDLMESVIRDYIYNLNDILSRTIESRTLPSFRPFVRFVIDGRRINQLENFHLVSVVRDHIYSLNDTSRLFVRVIDGRLINQLENLHLAFNEENLSRGYYYRYYGYGDNAGEILTYYIDKLYSVGLDASSDEGKIIVDAINKSLLTHDSKAAPSTACGIETYLKLVYMKSNALTVDSERAKVIELLNWHIRDKESFDLNFEQRQSVKGSKFDEGFASNDNRILNVNWGGV